MNIREVRAVGAVVSHPTPLGALRGADVRAVAVADGARRAALLAAADGAGGARLLQRLPSARHDRRARRQSVRHAAGEVDRSLRETLRPETFGSWHPNRV